VIGVGNWWLWSFSFLRGFSTVSFICGFRVDYDSISFPARLRFFSSLLLFRILFLYGGSSQASTIFPFVSFRWCRGVREELGCGAMRGREVVFYCEFMGRIRIYVCDVFFPPFYVVLLLDPKARTPHDEDVTQLAVMYLHLYAYTNAATRLDR